MAKPTSSEYSDYLLAGKIVALVVAVPLGAFALIGLLRWLVSRIPLLEPGMRTLPEGVVLVGFGLVWCVGARYVSRSAARMRPDERVYVEGGATDAKGMRAWAVASIGLGLVFVVGGLPSIADAFVPTDRIAVTITRVTADTDNAPLRIHTADGGRWTFPQGLYLEAPLGAATLLVGHFTRNVVAIEGA